jgi:hypothetical protein
MQKFHVINHQEKPGAASCVWPEDEAQKGLSVSGDMRRKNNM